jgi:hypothetical protein
LRGNAWQYEWRDRWGLTSKQGHRRCRWRSHRHHHLDRRSRTRHRHPRPPAETHRSSREPCSVLSMLQLTWKLSLLGRVVDQGDHGPGRARQRVAGCSQLRAVDSRYIEIESLMFRLDCFMCSLHSVCMYDVVDDSHGSVEVGGDGVLSRRSVLSTKQGKKLPMDHQRVMIAIRAPTFGWASTLQEPSGRSCPATARSSAHEDKPCRNEIHTYIPRGAFRPCRAA